MLGMITSVNRRSIRVSVPASRIASSPSQVGALALPGTAAAVLNGPITINGGNAYEQTQVRAALRMSTFDYTPVAARVTVTIARNIPTSDATSSGVVNVDANLLDAGTFSWGVVQHEMAHEVDFLYFSDADRAQLFSALGGASWWYTAPMLAHGDYGCERFASELSWAFCRTGSRTACIRSACVTNRTRCPWPPSGRS